jgi:uncharacterized protein YcfL
MKVNKKLLGISYVSLFLLVGCGSPLSDNENSLLELANENVELCIEESLKFGSLTTSEMMNITSCQVMYKQTESILNLANRYKNKGEKEKYYYLFERHNEIMIKAGSLREIIRANNK